MHVAGDEVDAEHYGHDEAKGLEGVGPDERLDAAAEGVEPDQEGGNRHINPERNMQRVAHERLQGDAHEHEAYGRSRHLRDEEEPRTGVVTLSPEPVAEVFVDGGELHAVVEGREDEGDNQLPHDEAHKHLQVAHATCGHHARHRDKGDARQAGANHGEGHHVPVRLAVADEETCIVGLVARKIRNDEEGHEVGRDSE